MALSLEQYEWMSDQIERFDADVRSVARGFEESFLTDLSERFKEEQEQMFLSARMFEILRRIGDQRMGMDWENYVSPKDIGWYAVKPRIQL